MYLLILVPFSFCLDLSKIHSGDFIDFYYVSGVCKSLDALFVEQ